MTWRQWWLAAALTALAGVALGRVAVILVTRPGAAATAAVLLVGAGVGLLVGWISDRWRAR